MDSEKVKQRFCRKFSGSSVIVGKTADLQHMNIKIKNRLIKQRSINWSCESKLINEKTGKKNRIAKNNSTDTCMLISIARTSMKTIANVALNE